MTPCPTDVDSYGRTVAVCHNGEVDVAAELARAGLALAYRQFSDDYVDEEQEAEAARRGAWAGTFTAPWDQRSSYDETIIDESDGERWFCSEREALDAGWRARR